MKTRCVSCDVEGELSELRHALKYYKLEVDPIPILSEGEYGHGELFLR